MNHPRLIVVYTILASSLFSYKLYSISVSDLLILPIVIFLGLKVKFASIDSLFFFLIFFLAGGAGYAVSTDFSGMLSFIKIFYYFVAFTSFYWFLRSQDVKCLSCALLTSFRIFSYISILIVIVFFVYGDAWFNVVNPGNVNRYDSGIPVYKVANFDIYRFNGYMKEPSWFALFLTLLVSSILYIERCYQKAIFNALDISLIIVLYGFMLSITGIVLLLLMLCYKYLTRLSIKKIFTFALTLFSFLCLVLFNSYIQARIIKIIEGEDGSTKTRLVKTFLDGFGILSDSYYMGVGFGNTSHFLTSLEGNSLQNVFSEVAAAAGIVGLLAFLLLFYFKLVTRKCYFLAIMLALCMMVSSVIYTPVYWVYLFLYLALTSRGKRARLEYPCAST